MRLALRRRKKAGDASWAYTQSVLTTVGNLTIMWAGIELMLTHLIVWYHERGGRAIRTDLPRMLTYQLEYLKKLERDIRFDQEVSDTLREIRLEITRLNEFRINLIHGVLHQRNRRSRDWHTHSVKIDGNGWRVVRATYTDSELCANVKAVSDLSHKMSPFIARVIGMPHPAITDHPHPLTPPAPLP